VRPEAASEIIASDAVVDRTTVEVAILQTDVEVPKHRRAHAGDQLPGQARILDGKAVRRRGGEGLPVKSDTGTTAAVDIE